VLDLTQKHLTLLHQKYDHYFFTINKWKNIAGPEIVFRLMLKCQRKNYPCPLEKNSWY